MYVSAIAFAVACCCFRSACGFAAKRLLAVTAATDDRTRFISFTPTLKSWGSVQHAVFCNHCSSRKAGIVLAEGRGEAAAATTSATTGTTAASAGTATAAAAANLARTAACLHFFPPL